MATISLSLPADGQTVDAADVNTPFNTIAAEFNGNIDNANVKSTADISGSKLLAGSIPGAKFDSTTYGGWIAGVLPAVSSVANNGQHSQDITFASTVAAMLTPGMRLRTSRTVAAPTQCTDLESGSAQFYSKTTPNKLTFTTTFTCMAWVKLESYVAGGIIARRNVDTEGWDMAVGNDGRLELFALRIAANNKQTLSYQSPPLNRWVHVAASMDVSVAGDASTVMYFDGVVVPSTTTTTGTCTALVQGTTALVVGARKSAGTEPFDGKIAQAAVFSAVLSAATIRSYMSQGLSGSETSIASAYSFNNSIVDLSTSTPNDLTPQGSALATNADSPFALDANGVAGGTFDYAIVTKVVTTVATVQTPEGCAIPTSGGVSATELSSVKSPFGMPVSRDRWFVELLLLVEVNTSAAVVDTTYNPGGLKLDIPLGQWNIDADFQTQVNSNAAVVNYYVCLSTSSTTINTGSRLNARNTIGIATSTATHRFGNRKSDFVNLSVATPYFILLRSGGAFTVINIRGDTAANVGEATSIRAELAYL